MATSVKKTPKEKQKQKPVINVAEKTTMNFARRESSFNTKKMMPYIIAIVIIGALFLKFGIFDPIGNKNDAIGELMSKQAQIDDMNAKLAEYDKLAEKYGRYSYGWMDDSEVNTIDRMVIMQLIEDKILPNANIDDASITEDVITLNLSGVTLQEASSIVKDLEQDELVESASVYSATAENAEQAEIFMSVVLNSIADEPVDDVQEGEANE